VFFVQTDVPDTLAHAQGHTQRHTHARGNDCVYTLGMAWCELADDHAGQQGVCVARVAHPLKQLGTVLASRLQDRVAAPTRPPLAASGTAASSQQRADVRVLAHKGTHVKYVAIDGRPHLGHLAVLSHLSSRGTLSLLPRPPRPHAGARVPTHVPGPWSAPAACCRRSPARPCPSGCPFLGLSSVRH
jgi:hypothetical protein